MHRRRFLSSGVRGALSFGILSLGACALRSRKRAESKGTLPWYSVVAEFEAQMPSLMVAATVPGVSIALIEDAKIVWRRGFGFADAATKVPVDRDTVFQAASMSKPVFAYVVLKLCEKGVIGLDTPLAEYAPEPFLPGDPRLDLITPRHLLSHSSGFQDWRSGDEPLRIHFAPGSRYQYSGEGYYYLQSVITHLTGQVDRTNCARFESGLEVCATNIDEFMREHILEPFGMNSSGYAANDLRERHGATGHDSDGNPFPKRRPTGPAIARYAAAGALLTTPTDYAKFLIEILNPKNPDNFRLSKGTISEMLRAHVRVVNGPYTSSWGLGWQIQDNGLINHGGDNKGFHCHAIASPKAKSGIVVMTNGDGGPKVIQRLFSLPSVDPFLGLQGENI